jgi:hypothetical protein
MKFCVPSLALKDRENFAGQLFGVHYKLSWEGFV